MSVVFTLERTGSGLSPQPTPVTITVGATPVSGGTATFLLSTNGSKVTLTDPATIGRPNAVDPATTVSVVPNVPLATTSLGRALLTTTGNTLGGITIGDNLVYQGGRLSAVIVFPKNLFFNGRLMMFNRRPMTFTAGVVAAVAPLAALLTFGGSVITFGGAPLALGS